MTITDARTRLMERLRNLAAQPEFRLSFSQQRVWFMHQIGPDRGVYNLPVAYRIRGPLDAAALERALVELVERHEVLASAFPTRDGVGRQVLRSSASIPLHTTDLSGAADAEASAQRLARDHAQRPFDIAHGPVLRADLLRLAPDDHLFLLTFHHIACDAWSLAVVGGDISASYNALREGNRAARPPLALQYADFSEWLTRRVREPLRGELARYWRERLAGIPACINLPTDRPRPPVQSYDGAYVAFDVPAALAAAVEELARRLGATPYVVLLSAFTALLERYTGGEEVVVGTPVANRHDARLEGIVGFFANTLVLRPSSADCRSFAELVGKVAVHLRDALAHQDLPFELLVEELEPQRDPAHSPIFQVMFMYWEGDYGAGWELPGCSVTAAIGELDTAKYDLTLHVTRTATALRARLEYATSLFDRATIERMSAHFLTLLSAAVARPDAHLATLEILPAAERQLLLREWASGGVAHSEQRLVHELISAQAERTPSATAVVDDERSLTYRELEGAAEGLASRLRALGVAPGAVVAVYLDRSVLTVVAMLGILKAGAAYLPLDPGYPAERLAFMVTDSGTAIVVSRVALLSEAGKLGASVVPVDGIKPTATGAPGSAPAADGLAYLIFTSGSTGRPKGVKITHRNLATFLGAMDATFGADGPGTWLAVTSISFDISVLELLWTLTRGYRVVVRRDEPSAAKFREHAPKLDPASRPVEFSLFFFGNAPADAAATASRYRMLFDAARFGDENGFAAVWTPERHFHAFGGLYPNPSVLAAALANHTKRIGIRAGSVVMPLHDPLRVAEEWALVDNLSGGRVGVSVASGWQTDDFVLAPERYKDRKQLMLRGIDEVRRLWRGERVRRRNGSDKEIEVAVYPRPIQAELPVWITSAQHPDTFRMAGEAGANILTHLIGHSVEELAAKLAIYREARRKCADGGAGHVTLMMHTFVGDDLAQVKSTVRGPLKEYIRTSFDLMARVGASVDVNMRELPAHELDQLLERGFERFFTSSGLLGTVEIVASTVEKLATIGVDEVGCLIDFGVEDSAALAALKHLVAARDEYLRRRGASSSFAEADEHIGAQLRRHEVTHLQCTPTLASVLVADPQSRKALRSLRRLLIGGEALPPELAAALSEAMDGTIHNMYGPTEATVWATTSRVTGERAPMIGRPLPGYSAYVVDTALQLVPIGVPGELLLGGPAIAAGYHGRVELTDEKFIPDHLSGTGRLYRTGDLARWRASGELEFLGRLDHQVKLRGRRIELGEIEAALGAHPALQRAVCDVRGAGDTKRVVAYCALASGQRLPDPAELRAFLGRVLPEHMVPAAYVSVASWPLTPNGKIDRRALPEPGHKGRAREQEFRAPAGRLEQTIAELWQQVLRIDRVGLDDNFFSIGGNSVLVVALRGRLVEQLGGDVSLVDMFRYPTVGALASALAARTAPQTSSAGAARTAAEAADRRRAAALRNRAKLSATGRSE